jgi:XTP/dITP diphosphohydrolase
MKKVVIASNNPGKLKEFAQLLAPFSFDAVPQAALGVSEAEEPFATFVENALAKARHAARATGLPALADDSGLCVPALGGAPGVWSARYAGEPKSDERNNEKLLAAMQPFHRAHDRRAFFYCALVFVMHADDPHPLIADGEWWGEIALEPRGTRGFGYNPVVLIPAFQQTVAEMADEDKNRLSHRAQAMQALALKLRRYLA